MLLTHESRRQLCAHGGADASTCKWIVASREPTTTPPRAGDARATGVSASAWQRNASGGDQNSVRTERLAHPSHPTPPKPRSQCRNTPPKQRITPLPLPLGRLRFDPVNLPAPCQSGKWHPVPERDPCGSRSGNPLAQTDDAGKVQRIRRTQCHDPTRPPEARRTRRRVSTASGSAYCSPVNPATNRPPRISPRASRRRNSRRRSRHGNRDRLARK